jgi:hypothetical protein
VIRGKRFDTVEAFVDRLAELLAPGELRKYQRLLVRHARVRDLGKTPPLRLSDGFAPFDDLTRPLLEKK